MNAYKTITSETEVRAKLSALWVFTLLNILFRDIHEFISPGFIGEVMTGTVNGTKVTEDLLLIGGFLVEVPIAMVLLSWIQERNVNRWVNVIAAIFTIVLILSSLPTDADDVFFTVIEIVSMLLVIRYAWKRLA